VRQRLGGNPSAPGPDRRGPPDWRPLPWWRGDHGRLPHDTHLVKEPCEAPSGLARRRHFVPTWDAGLTLPRRCQQRRLLRRWLRRTVPRGRLHLGWQTSDLHRRHLTCRGISCGSSCAIAVAGSANPRVASLPTVDGSAEVASRAPLTTSTTASSSNIGSKETTRADYELL
jgi:hypothetical protein